MCGSPASGARLEIRERNCSGKVNRSSLPESMPWATSRSIPAAPVGSWNRGRPRWRRAGGSPREENISTQQSSPFAQARIPSAHVRSCRPAHCPSSAVEGPSPAQRLIGTIRNRSDFDHLAKFGRSRSSGPLRVRFLHDDSLEGPRISYAIGRSAGTAVVRNRIRRRIRHAIAHLDRVNPLERGWYLIGARREVFSMDFGELQYHLTQSVAR